MKYYFERILLSYVEKKRQMLKLEKFHPSLAIIDSFRGRITTEFLSLLEIHNIIPITVPANCTDKLQPIDVSINKPIKDKLRCKFRDWHASKVEKQLKSVKVDKVKIKMATAAMKVKCAQWMTSAMQEIQKHPEIAENGFKVTGILSAITEVRLHNYTHLCCFTLIIV